MRSLFVASLLVIVAPPLGTAAEVPTFSPQSLEFFEKSVRPVLVEQCFRCHNDKKSVSGLRLDSREAVLKGGDSGPAAVPGDVVKSLIVRAIRHEGDIKMPEKGKLADSQVAAITEWVRQGLPWTPGPSTVVKAATKHWAFEPVTKPAIPEVKAVARVQSPIDRFVLQKLEEKNLTLSPPAEKRTLARRLYFDLIGLPPSPADVEAFEKDTAPDATARLVDKLLAMPQYGERWGRFWLDLARYSDTKGYVFNEDRNYPYAYGYRDWVVRAFNEDLPYDRFITEQIAADRVAGPDKRALAAMGFLTVGRRFLNDPHDIIDDRIDVVSRTFQGLTVACARCHDHKFDPIPARDYYSLYSIFASSQEPKDGPLLSEGAPKPPEVVAYEKELLQRETELLNFRTVRHAAVLSRFRTEASISAFLLAAYDTRSIAVDTTVLRERNLEASAMARWKAYLKEAAKAHSPVMAPYQKFFSLKEAEFAAKAPEVLAKLNEPDAAKPIHPGLLKALSERKPTSMKEVAEVYGKLIAVGKPANDPLGAVIHGAGSVLDIPVMQLEVLFDRQERDEVRLLTRKVDQLKATSPVAPTRAMVLVDKPTPFQGYVFLRGNQNNRGVQVPRQFLEVVAGPTRKPFADGSGRLDLAKAIADPKNPLTARVMVNRVWQWHFGDGLVRNPSDFGVRTESPVHRVLLDYLAARFVEEGWSIKKLHRQILLSSAWQQSSAMTPELVTADPENLLISRMNRRRLEFEALRDSMLAVTGKLDGKVGGRSEDIFKEPFSMRRTIYGAIERQNLPGTFRNFDFASPDAHSPIRYQTTVPQQALFLMNSPFVIQQARAVLGRSEIARETATDAKIQALYRTTLGRAPTATELAMGREFVTTPLVPPEPQPNTAAAWQQGYGRYNEATKKTEAFARLGFWTGEHWQGSAQLPDPKIGWCMLTPLGGHPGLNPEYAVIRRWTSPIDGKVRVSGVFEHLTKWGDGGRARVVHSRSGELGNWKAHENKTNTEIASIEVKKGDILDLITDCVKDVTFDAFIWAPVIEQIDGPLVWNSNKDYRGPAAAIPANGLTAWELYAQVLLLYNEFAFID